TLDDNRILEAYVDIPLERAAALHVDMPVEIVDADGKVLVPTAVSFISPRASADTQTILMKAQIPNRRTALRAGQFTRARGIWSVHDGRAVPVLAVQSKNGHAFAWVVAEARGQGLTAQPRAVEVGPMQAQLYPVLRGLQPGDKIVVSGVQKLAPGARVVAMPP